MGFIVRCDRRVAGRAVQHPTFRGGSGMRASLGFELRALQVFATVCELRNMTLAAKRLGMTQPAVSYTIKQLEDVMGVKLIDRNRRPLAPTAGGDWLAAAAAQILHD